MFRWIVGSSLKYRFIVLAIAAALMLVGADQMRDLRVDVFPEFAPTIVDIHTPASDSPRPREALVTIPMEQALAGLPPWTSSFNSVTDFRGQDISKRSRPDAVSAALRKD